VETNIILGVAVLWSGVWSYNYFRLVKWVTTFGSWWYRWIRAK